MQKQQRSDKDNNAARERDEKKNRKRVQCDPLTLVESSLNIYSDP